MSSLNGATTDAGFDLLTAEEMAAESAAGDTPGMRVISDPLAPKISLLAPQIDAPVRSPIDIRLRWSTNEDAVIDLKSIVIRYGRLGLDVTSRILKSANVTPDGIDATGARLPTGQHRLTVAIADDKRRVGQKQFLVTVVE